MTDEEVMYKDRTHILEGKHWMNKVLLRSKARATASTMQRIKFERDFEILEDLWANYQAL